MAEKTADRLFDLSLTEEQRITRENLAKFSQTELGEISRSADEEGAAPAGFYNKTAELGLSILPIPEAYGGAGVERSPISNMLNAEDLGQGDMSLAIGALTPLAFINTVLDQGTENQREKYLTPLAEEYFKPATIALMEPKATFEPSDLATNAKKDGKGYVINGIKSMVALGASSQFILVIANLEGEGPAGFIVEQGATGLTVEKEDYMGLRPLELSRVTLENVSVNAVAKLGEEEKKLDLQRILDLSKIGLCAVAVGCCRAVLEYVKPYVVEREAFGEPIAYRQSVAFMVANMAIELEGMQLLVYRAAARAEQGLSFKKEAYLAKVFCAERSMEIGTNGIQLLGGHGFCREHPVELWYRNLRAVGVLDGVVAV
ncbi:MAG: acyl-CoA dehydrogenase family protein [Pseudomonadales bacterium]|nr:acyl-CoA dehydrogenase family protein [Pseudomonadales bacterium]